jgi:glycosyltransferase involved in cell wall biosynthesis
MKSHHAELPPLVTIIVTCFNYGKYLNDALVSVARQSLHSWECIIVDDGSTDSTCEIATAWTAKDQRFSYIYQENSGVSSARNAGLNRARGRYIQILDADDLLEVDKLSIDVAMLESTSENTSTYSSYIKQVETRYHTSIEKASETSVRPGKNLIISLVWDWERTLSIPPHCFMHRRSKIDAIGGFNVNLVTHEDFDLLHRLAISGGELIYNHRPLVVYRRHEHSMCRDRFGMVDGYLHALGLALQRSRKKRLKILTLIRYAMEVENFITLSILNIQFSRALQSLWQTRFASLTLTGITLYPFIFTIRLPKRSAKVYKRLTTQKRLPL